MHRRSIAGLGPRPARTYRHGVGNAPPARPARVHDRPRLGELLVADGCITPEQLDAALREQSSWGGRLGQSLVDGGLIDERTLAGAIARQLHLPVADLDRTSPPDDVHRLVPVALAERYGLIPVGVARERARIVIACVDPTSNDAMREVRRTTGLIPEVCVATASEIDRAIRRHYYGEDEPIPTPSPHLDVTRRTLAPQPAPGDRFDGLERRLDRLLDMVKRDEAAGD